METNDDKEKIRTAIRIGTSGLWRFYDDGFTRWPRTKLAPLFLNMDLDNPDIQKEFQSLEINGFIKIFKMEDCYLEVIQVPK